MSCSSFKAKVQMVKRLIFSYYSIPAIASYVDFTLSDAQVDGSKVSPSSMLMEGCACYSLAGDPLNSRHYVARQHGAGVYGNRTLIARRYWGYHLLQVRSRLC